MDRYSILYGTTSAGYDRLGISDGLPTFLSRMGATSLNFTTSKVERMLCGFQKLDGYDRQPTDDLPLAVRYAPMHLYRLADFPQTMEPFCVLAVCGAENQIGGRDGIYFHTTYFPRTVMHRTTEGYTYLDQLFGTHLTNSADVEGHRSGKLPVDLEALPDKVTPKMDIRDAGIVLNAVHAIYQEKTVLIRLKKGCAFNRSAFRLLPQIYSMLQPRLAAEIGFATYQDPQKIRELATQTSTRIFILPSECALEQLDLREYMLLDLEDPASYRFSSDDELMKWLKWWYKLPWADRLSAYTHLFDRDDLDYLSREKFMEISAGFKNNPFFQWIKSGAQTGSISTAVDLQKKKRSFPICAIDWVGSMFDRRIPELLKPHTLEELTAEAAVEAILGPDKERGKAEYLAGLELGCKDVTTLACKKTQEQAKTIAQQTIAELKTTHESEKVQLQQTFDCKTADLTRLWEDRIAALHGEMTALQDAHLQEERQWQDTLAKQKKDDEARLAKAHSAMEAIRVEAAQTLAKVQTEAAAALARQEESAAQALSQQRAESDTVLQRQQQETERQLTALKEQAAKHIQAERAQAQAAQERAAQAAQALERCRRETEVAQTQLEEERSAHEETRKRLRKLQNSSGSTGVRKKNLLIAAGMGFLSGLLVLGIVWGATALLGGRDTDADRQNFPLTTQETTPGTQTTGTTDGSAPSGEATAP